jgi:hypothetical protein
MSAFKTAVLIHGCHVQAREWNTIVLGDYPRGRLGRIPKGLQVADMFAAELVIWGTGASQFEGAKEAEVMRSAGYAYTQIHPTLSKWKCLDEAKNHLDTVSQNTADEIAAAGIVCQERGITRLVLVSSPTHIARCHQEALKLRAEGKLPGIEIMAMASDTCFADSTPGDVIIIEPPHRGDQPLVPMHLTIRKIFALMKVEWVMRGFLADLEDLIVRWKNRI